jgi:sulfur-oxidizing protein SoxX
MIPLILSLSPPGRGRWWAVSLLALMIATAAAADEKLVPFRVVGDGIPQKLTDQPGDAARGRRLVFDRQKGNCLVCHGVPGVNSPGDLGPDLAGVASRHSVAELRLRLVDPQRLNPDSPMPAFYKTDGLVRVAQAFEGKPLLQPQEIEDVLAFLETLK